MPWIMAGVVLALTVSLPAAAADVYSWTDASGGVHYTDTPPTDRQHSSVDITAPVTVPMANNLDQHRNVSGVRKQVQGLLAPDRKRDSARKKQEADARTKQELACTSYKEKLARIQSQLRSGYENSKGNSLRRQRRKLSRSLSRECILR